MTQNELDTQLANAVKARDVAQCRTLLRQGAKIIATGTDGWTTAHDAACTGSTIILRLLFANGTSPEAVTRSNWSLLHVVAACDHLDACRLLLEKGANTQIKANDRYTPLHAAAELNHAKICQLLLAYGANPAWTDRQHRNPLHIAAQMGSVEACKVLADSSPTLLKAKDTSHDTPLLTAIRHGKIAVVDYFLRECSEDIEQKTHDGKTLEEMAQYNSRHEMAEFLRACRHSLKAEHAIRSALDQAGEPATSARQRSASPL